MTIEEFAERWIAPYIGKYRGSFKSDVGLESLDDVTSLKPEEWWRKYKKFFSIQGGKLVKTKERLVDDFRRANIRLL